MGFSVAILLDSVSESGARLVTYLITAPRFILPQLSKHRVFSLNTASSRAIPTEKLIQSVIDDPVIPLSWGSNKSGMQAGPELTGTLASASKRRWLDGRDAAVRVARDLSMFGVHKELTNRVLEPYMWTTIVLSATSFVNFFAQRCHPSTQPDHQYVANEMRRLQQFSTPTLRLPGEYHMPLLRVDDAALSDDVKRKVSVARCARTSYNNHNGVRSVEDDLQLFNKLVLSDPPHLSPAEHVATPGDGTGNYVGWNQLRKQYEY